MKSLRGYQKIGVEYLRSHRRALLADEQGLGKTATAITYAREFERVLIVAPSFLRLNWLKELKIWDRDFNRKHIQIIDTGNQKINSDITIISYNLATNESIYKQLRKEKYDLLLVDESHYLKSPIAQRTRYILGNNAIRGVFSRCGRTVFMTGTPFVNHAGEIFTTMARFIPRELQKDFLHKYMNFCQKFCYMQHGRSEIVPRKVRNEEILKALLGRFMIRRKKADVLKELPPKTLQVFELGTTAKLKKLIREEKGYTVSDIEKLYNGLSTDDIHRLENDSRNKNGELARLRRLIGEAKVPLILPHILNDLEQVEKVVIFAWHINVIESLADELKAYSPVILTGSKSMRNRQESVDAFQTNPDVRVFIGQMKAAGVGWTLTAASVVYIAESWYVPGDIDQAIDRLHRIGQPDNVFAKFFVVPNSLDAKILDCAFEKQKYLDLVV